ncbi:cupin-like domain-containing protein [Altererythrobacter sp. ZODW24]|uniref:cupin-like domain-containing protein n=1 Tax=Altererythrobacter sp. ZODW24 TaxID=2185142 RepID=UPI001F077982|nr:cupin-like domain-containing protein [Altererythrobacter sp. ZODW24]
MTTALSEPAAIPELASLDRATFQGEIRKAAKPVVIRGLVKDWPAVQAGLSGAETVTDYITSCEPRKPVRALAAKPSENGRFFYNERLDGMNFMTAEGQLEAFLGDLMLSAEIPEPPAMAVQSEIIQDLMPAFAQANSLDLLPDVPARIWIGNRIRVAPHYDLKENIACCVSGRRRFTLFPPEQVSNLYPGPFELTPAGTPVSMVELAAPDLEKYPRFAEAAKTALAATLEPGDAIYIPYTWWHGVESLDPVSVLVNYWWHDAPEGTASPYGALLHALLAYRHLPEDQRKSWRATFDHYVFAENGDPGAHLPEHARGIMGPPTPEMFGEMRAMIKQIVG